MYGQPQLKPWTSRRWLPEGYLTRMRRDEDYFKRHRGDDDDGNAGAAVRHDEDALDDRTTAVPSGRPSRAVDDDRQGAGLEKKRSGSGSGGGGSGDLERETREEKVNRAV